MLSVVFFCEFRSGSQKHQGLTGSEAMPHCWIGHCRVAIGDRVSIAANTAFYILANIGESFFRLIARTKLRFILISVLPRKSYTFIGEGENYWTGNAKTKLSIVFLGSINVSSSPLHFLPFTKHFKRSVHKPGKGFMDCFPFWMYLKLTSSLMNWEWHGRDNVT